MPFIIVLNIVGGYVVSLRSALSTLLEIASPRLMINESES